MAGSPFSSETIYCALMKKKLRLKNEQKSTVIHLYNMCLKLAIGEKDLYWFVFIVHICIKQAL
jgi:hypothetical protein